MRIAALVGWSASIAAHAAVVAITVWFLGGESTESMLFIDLTEVASGGAGGGSQVGPSSAPSERRPQVAEKAAPSRVESRPQIEPSPAAPLSPVPPSAPVTEPSRAPDVVAAPLPSPSRVPPSSEDTTGAASTRTATPGQTGAERGASGATVPGGTGARGPASGLGAGRDTTGGATGSAGGEGQGTALARTSTGPGDGVDERAYHELVRRHIRDSLEYPSIVRRRGLSGTVEIEIVVRPDGVIRDVTLVRSSSSRALDDAAVEAVKQLPRLRFPSGLTPRTLRVLVPVVFDLR